MNKFFGLKSLTMGLFMAVAALLTTQSAQAQGSLDQSVAVNYNWITEAEAVTVLEATLVQLGNDLATLQPGSPAYINAENRRDFYKMTLTQLQEVHLVRESVLFAVAHVNDTKTTFSSLLNSNQILQLFNGAVGLLTN